MAATRMVMGVLFAVARPLHSHEWWRVACHIKCGCSAKWRFYPKPISALAQLRRAPQWKGPQRACDAEPCDIAALRRGFRAPNQQLAKGFDFLCDEIAERPHAGCPPHVTVSDQVEVQSKCQSRAEPPDKIRLVIELEIQRARRKQLLDAERSCDHLLVDGKSDDRLQRLAVGVDPVGKRIADHRAAL